MTIATPLLTIFADIIGIMGGFLIGITYLKLSPTAFVDRMANVMVLKDIITSVVKSFVFAWLITIVGVFFGLRAKGGAGGVGRSTTASVVTAIFMVICLLTRFWVFYSINCYGKIIEVKDLITEFDGRRILDGITLDIKENEVFIILGGSGCGKTTLLKHIIGLLKPVSGSIKVFDKEIVGIEEEDLDEILMKCGVLFQNGALLNSLSVGENVAIPLEQHSNLDRELINRIIETKLNLVELAHAMYLSTSELSGGMKKRAAPSYKNLLISDSKDSRSLKSMV